MVQERTAHRVVFFISFACAIGGFVVGGLLGSASVLNDAGHLLVDSLGFFIVLAGFQLSARKGTNKYTFGFQKLEALGTLFSVFLLLVVSGIVYYISVLRIEEIASEEFEPIDGWPIFGMGLASFVANVIMAVILSKVSHHGHGHSHDHGSTPGETEAGNVATVSIQMTGAGEKMFVTPKSSGWSSVAVVITRGSQEEVLTFDWDGEVWISHQVPNEPHEFAAVIVADGHNVATFSMYEPQVKWSSSFRNSFAHILGHLVQSMSVILVAIVILSSTSNQAQMADPIVAMISAAMSLALVIPVTTSVVRILLDSAPERIPVKRVMDAILRVRGVTSVHDLHLWRLKSGYHCLTAHIAVDTDSTSRILQSLHQASFRLGIHHATFQLEQEIGDHHSLQSCGVCSSDVTTNQVDEIEVL